MTRVKRRRPTGEFAGLLRRHMTVISGRAARASGRTHALRTCLASGSVVAVLPNIYAAKGVEHHPKVRLAAASTWSEPDGAITGLAAAFVWQLVDTAPGRITVAFPKPRHRGRTDWLRTRRLTEEVQLLNVNGKRVVDVENALIQSWNELDPKGGVAIIVDAVRCERTSAAHLRRIANGRVRISRKTDLMALLALVEDGITSYLEHVARTTVFTDVRFPDLHWQRPTTAERRDRYIDIFDHEAQLGIELDSAKYHGSDGARRADLRRGNELSTVGMHLLHFTFEDITERPEWCIEIYLKTRAVRIRQLRGSSGDLA